VTLFIYLFFYTQQSMRFVFKKPQFIFFFVRDAVGCKSCGDVLPRTVVLKIPLWEQSILTFVIMAWNLPDLLCLKQLKTAANLLKRLAMLVNIRWSFVVSKYVSRQGHNPTALPKGHQSGQDIINTVMYARSRFSRCSPSERWRENTTGDKIDDVNCKRMLWV